MLRKDNISLRILILNYNGRKLLEECLPSILQASRQTRHECKVAVIDNVSTDTSVSFLKNHYPDIQVIEQYENLVLCAFNKVLEEGTEDLSILLNNDMKVDPGFIDPLVDVFAKNEDAFFASPKIMSFDGTKCENGSGMTRMRYGLFWAISRYPGYEKDVDRPALISHGASGAFLRERFVELKGFDTLYLPGIMEEADLCFRAYKQGMRCYYVPKSIVFHMGRASFKKVYAQKRIEALAHRNTFLFMWKNISCKKYLFQHVFFLIPRLLIAILSGKFEFVSGFFQALPLFPEAAKRRRSQKAGKKEILTDEKVMGLFIDQGKVDV